MKEIERKNLYYLSPLTNHKDIQRGLVTDSFERKQYSELVKYAFDRVFAYERPLVETLALVKRSVPRLNERAFGRHSPGNDGAGRSW